MFISEQAAYNNTGRGVGFTGKPKTYSKDDCSVILTDKVEAMVSSCWRPVRHSRMMSTSYLLLVLELLFLNNQVEDIIAPTTVLLAGM